MFLFMFLFIFTLIPFDRNYSKQRWTNSVCYNFIKIFPDKVAWNGCLLWVWCFSDSALNGQRHTTTLHIHNSSRHEKAPSKSKETWVIFFQKSNCRRTETSILVSQSIHNKMYLFEFYERRSGLKSGKFNE